MHLIPGKWHALHTAHTLHLDALRPAAFALAALVGLLSVMHVASQPSNPLLEVEHWAGLPYAWFVENMTAWAMGGFNR